MTLRWLLAAIHLLALGIGLGAVVGRGRALSGPLDASRIRTVLFADAAWGIAALLWLVTGLWRAFGGLEKGSSYYLNSTAFWIKMTLFFGIFVLEMMPMMALTRWRRDLARGATPDVIRAPTMARISKIQAVLLVAIVFAATAMARGLGA